MVSWFTFIPHLTITWITHIPLWPTIARGKDYFSSLHHTWFLIFYKRPLLIDTLPLVSQTSSSPSFVNSLHLSVLCRYFSSVQLLTRVQLFTTPWTAAHQASLSITNSQSCTQTHVHWVGDVIQPSHPLSFPSPPTFNLSQHQGFFKSQLFTSGGLSASTSVLPMNTQDWSPLGWTDWISLQSKGLSRVFSNTTVRKHQFFSAQPSSQSNSHIHTWPEEKP